MTAIQLLSYIALALLLQVVAGVAFALRRLPARGSALPPGAVQAVTTAFSGAWPGWRDFRVVRRVYEDAAQTQCSFHLQPVDGALLAPFQPGQYLTFSLQVPDGGPPGAGVERAITRCYSLSDCPQTTGFRITVKRVPPPAGRPELPPGVSSNHFHDHVHEGGILQVKAPSGHFVIDQDAAVPAVLIAGGVGITPMMSMLRWCVVEQPGRTVHLYYGVRNKADHAFLQDLQALAQAHPQIKLHVVYSSPGPEDVLGRDYQHAGYINLELLRGSLAHGRHKFYVCGPAPLMQSLVPALRDWGVQDGDIHFEAFGPASVRPAGLVTNEPLAAPLAPVEVRLHRAGRTLVWDGQDGNLLDFLERHGVPVEAGCRSGSCGTCETALVSGAVGYAARPDHDVAAGCCLLCVGKPQTALVLDL